ncbi:YdcF family protein [Vicingaceae bacterium]|nr:YdcF family protein [Vicingaceae bacterium]
MIKSFSSWFKKLLLFLGAFSLVFIILSFTSLPYWAYYGLAATDDQLEVTPSTIVIMGGDGMPSPSGLMRLYIGTEKALQHPDSKVIIALPYNEFDSTYQLSLMVRQLVEKGVDSKRIIFAPNGFNTRSQALEIKELVDTSVALLIVSSPEHMYRSIHSFRKVGFQIVGGSPSFEKPSDEEKLKDETDKDDMKVRNLALRYNIWSYMQYEIIVLREYTAIAYYRIKGWI